MVYMICTMKFSFELRWFHGTLANVTAVSHSSKHLCMAIKTIPVVLVGSLSAVPALSDFLSPLGATYHP